MTSGRFAPLVLAMLVLNACAQTEPPKPPAAAYLDYSGRDDVLTGGVKMIPIATPKGPFKVWTKRAGNSPTMKVLLLHGGPGATHEYMEAFDSYFPAARKLIESPGLAWLIGLQVFRVAVEIFLALGYRAGFVPVQMTVEGRNWDVLTGLTALPMASSRCNIRREK